MKKPYVVILLVFLNCGCKTDLTIRDLKFADYERESIAANKVDTTYLIAKNPFIKWSYGELIPSNIGDTTRFMNWRFEDVGFVTYDSLGRLVCDESKRWKTYSYLYDSAGILNFTIYREWDVRLEYSSTYKFFPDSLVLHQNWRDQGWQMQGPQQQHISIFRFNSQGQLIHEFNDNDNTVGITRATHRIFNYKNSKLRMIEEQILVNDSVSFRRDTELFFSINGKLDSTVAEIYSKNDGQYKMVTMYDNQGLKSKSILMDSLVILYRHTRRE